MTSSREQRTVDHKIFHDLEDFRHLIVDVVAGILDVRQKIFRAVVG